MRILSGILICVGLCLVSATNAVAQFTLLENFESLTLGNIGLQGGWSTSNATNGVVSADPILGTNQVLHRVGAGGTWLSVNIPDASTNTFFFRLRYDSAGAIDEVVGLSDVAAPGGTNFGAFEVQSGILTGNQLRGRDGGSQQSPSSLINTNAWYNVWMVVDTTADSWRFLVQSSDDPDFSTQTELFSSTAGNTDWDFRNGVAANPLLSFYTTSNNGGTSAFYDDLYSAPGTLLTLPSGIQVILDGDVDLNGVVDEFDYFTIRDHFRLNVAGRAEGDLDGNGIVDFVDYAKWANNVTPLIMARAMGTAVPEPTSLALATLALTFLAVSRRHSTR